MITLFILICSNIISRRIHHMKYLQFTFSSLILLLLLSACEVNSGTDPEGMEVKVAVSSGDVFTATVNGERVAFLPYLTNNGWIERGDERAEVAIIGQRLKAGKTLRVRPLAILKYRFEQKDHKVILAIPVVDKYRSVDIDSYESLLTEYFATKQLIESWYANRYGLGRVSNISWSVYK